MNIRVVLSSVQADESVRITAMWAEDEVRRALEEIGITEASEIRVKLKTFDGVFVIEVKGRCILIDEEVAQRMVVKKIGRRAEYA